MKWESNEGHKKCYAPGEIILFGAAEHHARNALSSHRNVNPARMIPFDGFFEPSWKRALAATLLMVGAFLIPQEAPLGYLAPSRLGKAGLLLEISCASDTVGEVKILVRTPQGVRGIDTLEWPVAPSEGTYTYDFSLPDAPIEGFQLEAPGRGGTFTITRMEVKGRDEKKFFIFTREMFAPISETASIFATPAGWRIVSKPAAYSALVSITPGRPIISIGFNRRNLQRCLLSSTYLALILVILMLALYCASHHPGKPVFVFAQVAFIAFLAVLLSLVGNRRLIRDSMAFGRDGPRPASEIPLSKPTVDVTSQER